MTSERSSLPSRRHPIDLFLSAAFCVVLILRFFFPFFYNPYNSRYTDMLRHLENGQHLFHPTFQNGVDPKTYQVWLYLLQLLPTNEMASFSAFFTGLLCAGMAWFWYKALREITTRRMALIIAIAIGAHLSLLVIYAFFMIETMVLTTTALASWLALRAARKRTEWAYLAAMIAWTVAAFAKPTVLPLMALGMGYAIYPQNNKPRLILLSGAIFFLFLAPAAWQGIKTLHFFTPFGCSEMQVISRKSERLSYGLRMRENGPMSSAQIQRNQQYPNSYENMHHQGNDGMWWFPESYYSNVLEPFGTYVSTRERDPFFSEIDLSKGSIDWNEIIRKLAEKRSWSEVLRDYKENLIFLFFSFSWPDSEPATFTNSPPVYLFRSVAQESHEPKSLVRLNFHLRWLWFPCFLLVLLRAPFARLSPGKTWFVCGAFAMTWFFLLQDTGVVEGRYRKVLEPYLIAATFFLVESFFVRAPGINRISLRDFIWKIYVVPFCHRFYSAIFDEPARQQLSAEKGKA